MKKAPQQQTPPPQVEMSRNDFRLDGGKREDVKWKEFRGLYTHGII